MKPTPQLRFVLRNIEAPDLGRNMLRSVRILQQLWQGEALEGTTIACEWRDVPLEIE
jgi:hypothetical protein